MDVRMPDGTLIRDVPDDMTQDQLSQKLADNGHDVPAPDNRLDNAKNDVLSMGKAVVDTARALPQLLKPLAGVAPYVAAGPGFAGPTEDQIRQSNLASEAVGTDVDQKTKAYQDTLGHVSNQLEKWMTPEFKASIHKSVLSGIGDMNWWDNQIASSVPYLAADIGVVGAVSRGTYASAAAKAAAEMATKKVPQSVAQQYIERKATEAAAHAATVAGTTTTGALAGATGGQQVQDALNELDDATLMNYPEYAANRHNGDTEQVAKSKLSSQRGMQATVLTGLGMGLTGLPLQRFIAHMASPGAPMRSALSNVSRTAATAVPVAGTQGAAQQIGSNVAMATPGSDLGTDVDKAALQNMLISLPLLPIGGMGKKSTLTSDEAKAISKAATGKSLDPAVASAKNTLVAATEAYKSAEAAVSDPNTPIDHATLTKAKQNVHNAAEDLKNAALEAGIIKQPEEVNNEGRTNSTNVNASVDTKGKSNGSPAASDVTTIEPRKRQERDVQRAEIATPRQEAGNDRQVLLDEQPTGDSTVPVSGADNGKLPGEPVGKSGAEGGAESPGPLENPLEGGEKRRGIQPGASDQLGEPQTSGTENTFKGRRQELANAIVASDKNGIKVQRTPRGWVISVDNKPIVTHPTLAAAKEDVAVARAYKKAVAINPELGSVSVENKPPLARIPEKTVETSGAFGVLPRDAYDTSPQQTKPSKELAQGIADEFHKEFGIPIHVHDNVDTVTGINIESAREAKAKGIFRVSDNSIHLIHGNAESEAGIRTTLAHEVVGHYGVRGLLGKDYNKVMDQIAAQYPDLHRKLATQNRIKLGTDEARRSAAEEVFAYAAGERISKGQKAGIMEKIVSVVRNALRKVGAIKSISQADIHSIIDRAAKWVKDRQHGSANEEAESTSTPNKMGMEVPENKGGWHSALRREVSAINQEKASPEQWKGMIKNLKGVKPEEVNWLGVNDWLDEQKGSVTKSALMDHIREHDVQLGEKILVGSKDMYKGDEWQQAINRARAGGNESEANRIQAEYDALERNPDGSISESKFDKYTLSGGKSYKEMLLTMPVPDHPSQWVSVPNEKESERTQRPIRDLIDKRGNVRSTMPQNKISEYLRNAVEKAGPMPSEFKSAHFDEPNILSHIRFDERKDAEGKKVMHIAEVQSDWHQKGRKQGYTPSKTHPAGWAETNDSRSTGNGVPDAPFKTTWHELAMKRAIQYAAHNGFDRVSWDTGETQADRYDLSKQIKFVKATRTMQGAYHIEARAPNNAIALDDVYSEDRLPDVVGKDLAEKIISQSKGENIYLGLDLKVGGEGMRGFYDKMLPTAVNKMVKKYGSSVSMGPMAGGANIEQNGASWKVTLPDGDHQSFKTREDADQYARMFGESMGAKAHSFDITPELRAAATSASPITAKFEATPDNINHPSHDDHLNMVNTNRQQQADIMLSKRPIDEKRKLAAVHQAVIENSATRYFELNDGGKLTPKAAAKLIGASNADKVKTLQSAGMPATAALLQYMVSGK